MDNMIDFDDIFNGYLVCALWSSTDVNSESGEFFDENYTTEDFCFEALTILEQFVKKFMEENTADINKALETVDNTQIGHSLWLSSNGHGAGFFDYSGDEFDRLQEAARGNGFDLWFEEDDEKIHCIY